MNEEINLSVEDQAFSIDNGTTVYTKKLDARSKKSGTRMDSANAYLSLRIKRCARRGYSVDKLAGYIAKHNPLFPVEQLIKEGYLKNFPYTNEELLKVHDLWFTVRERDLEAKFKLLIKEVRE